MVKERVDDGKHYEGRVNRVLRLESRMKVHSVKAAIRKLTPFQMIPGGTAKDLQHQTSV